MDTAGTLYDRSAMKKTVGGWRQRLAGFLFGTEARKAAFDDAIETPHRGRPGVSAEDLFPAGAAEAVPQVGVTHETHGSIRIRLWIIGGKKVPVCDCIDTARADLAAHDGHAARHGFQNLVLRPAGDIQRSDHDCRAMEVGPHIGDVGYDGHAREIPQAADLGGWLSSHDLQPGIWNPGLYQWQGA